MKDILAIIGFVVVVMCIVGAIVPGWNFHAVFGRDRFAHDWHLKIAAQLNARMKDDASEVRK